MALTMLHVHTFLLLGLFQLNPLEFVRKELGTCLKSL